MVREAVGGTRKVITVAGESGKVRGWWWPSDEVGVAGGREIPANGTFQKVGFKLKDLIRETKISFNH